MIPAEHEWHRKAGARRDELARLRTAIPDLPELLYELLAYSNGGEGPLPIHPLCFVLDSADEIVEGIRLHQADFAGFLIFGSNGGGEYIAFDLRGTKPWPVVYIDMVAGPSTAKLIASDFEAFLLLIGRE